MRILLVGCGHMGKAMLAGWLKQSDVTHVDVIDPSGYDGIADVRVHMYADPVAWAHNKNFPQIVVLAVKPQTMEQINRTLPAVVPEGIPVLSIAAGITLTNLANAWGEHRPIIRAMPNTPGAIGQGVTCFVVNKNVKPDQIDIVDTLLSALGFVYRIANESLIDAVTALSGSGPGYVFYFTEALQKAGEMIGLPHELAAALARQTVIGSAALLSHDINKTPEALRQAVTSPGGTTAAALRVLVENRGLEKLLNDALEAAKARSQELAQSQ